MQKIIICIIAGLGAGLGTGFAGMSAAAVISPMLITFLDMDPYMAVGIALASDVLASAASAVTYGRNKNIDIRNGIIMMLTVLCFTMVGSYVASVVPKTTMGNFSVFMTLLLGIKFIVKPVTEPKKRFSGATANQKAVRLMLKTWIKTAEIQDVGAYFAVSDAKKELSGWSPRLRVSSRGYMLGYQSLDDPSVPGFYRFLAKVGDGMMRMQIVQLEFAEGEKKL